MNRLYETHPKRAIKTLDGVWQLKIDPDKIGLEKEWFKALPSDNQEVVVPSCWNNELGLYHYEGYAWYQTEFTTDQGTGQLQFYGVTGDAVVYVDGVEQGSHYGGFTGFDIRLTDIEAGVHTLVVMVDNTHNSVDTIPLAVVDWFHYGGITRGVEWVKLPETWISKNRIDYTVADDNSVSIDVSLEIEGAGADKMTVYMDDTVIYEGGISAGNNIKVEDIQLWEMDSPKLYDIKVDIGTDSEITRIGFRTITIANQKISLNDKELYLKGVNRHEDHPDWGFAVPLKLMKKDMDILKDMGCNMIRGSHYPNAPIFLDMCDQEGMLFMEEIPMWGFPEAALTNETVIERGLMMHKEMVERDYHHPCIIMWGMHNEVDTDTKGGYETTKKFIDFVKFMDTTRPLTYATNRPLRDIALDLVDVICVNRYIGWYRGPLPTWPAFLEEFYERTVKLGVDDKPIVMSEFGAGSIRGDQTLEGAKWSETYQEEYFDYTLNLFYKEERISGSLLWQFTDIRTAKEKEMDRPRSYNNKGLLDEYRRPKLAYWTVKRLYNTQ